jgi:GTP cyclohydrolase I
MMDRSKMEQGIRTFLEGMGVDTEREDMARTPERVARAWSGEIVSGYSIDPDEVLTFSPIEPGSGPVLVRGISFASVCQHHLLPFFGVAHVAYVPHRRLAGLSKIGRVIDAHARRLQTQEELTRAVVATLQHKLEPVGAIALLEAEHTCMTLRGVRKETSRMLTIAAAGIFDSDPGERSQILQLLNGGGRPVASR